MSETMQTIESIGLGVAYVVFGLVILLIAKIIMDWLTPYKIDDQLTGKDNPALGLTVAAYLLGVVIIYLGAVIGPETQQRHSVVEILADWGVLAGYALGGVLALNLGRWVFDTAVLTQFSTVKEIIEDRNVGTGAAEGGSYVATALIIAGAIHGEGGGPLTAIVFFMLGQLVLILFARFYQFMTQYDLHAEIEKNNTAAGVAFGLSMVAIGVIVMKASYAPFESWGENLSWFAIEAVVGFVVLLILRKVTDALFLPKSTLAHEIATDQNINAAWIEGVVAIGIAVMIFVLL